MNTHKLLLFILLMPLAFVANAQLKNCNPDPNGEPWWCGNLKLTPEVIAKMQAIPIMTLSPQSAARSLEYKVDNSLKNFMRPVFAQQG